MRRFLQQMKDEEVKELLEKGSSGVLTLNGKEGFPYSVPMSYVYGENCIYFHCAKSGEKLELLEKSDKASFCVITTDNVAPARYTTLYRSAVVVGEIHKVADPEEINRALVMIGKKYNPDDTDENLEKFIAKQLSNLIVLKMKIVQLTGKQSMDFVAK